MSLLGMEAVICPELTKFVMRSEPAKRTTEVGTKPLPFTVSVKPGPLADLVDGEMLVVTGTGLFTGKVWSFDVPPPGVVLKTVMLNVPPVVRSEVRMAAVSWLALTKVVVRLAPLYRTTEVETKFVPLTVMVNPLSP